MIPPALTTSRARTGCRERPGARASCGSELVVRGPGRSPGIAAGGSSRPTGRRRWRTARTRRTAVDLVGARRPRPRARARAPWRGPRRRRRARAGRRPRRAAARAGRPPRRRPGPRPSVPTTRRRAEGVRQARADPVRRRRGGAGAEVPEPPCASVLPNTDGRAFPDDVHVGGGGVHVAGGPVGAAEGLDQLPVPEQHLARRLAPSGSTARRARPSRRRAARRRRVLLVIAPASGARREARPRVAYASSASRRTPAEPVEWTPTNIHDRSVRRTGRRSPRRPSPAAGPRTRVYSESARAPSGLLGLLTARFSLRYFCAAFFMCFSPLSFACAMATSTRTAPHGGRGGGEGEREDETGVTEPG